MNTLDIFTKVYGLLHNYQGIPYWVLTPFRKLVRLGANKMLPRYLAKPHVLKGKQEKNVIVSFTSFPTRINNVWQVVECMLRQTYQPAKIILWLSKEQFPNSDEIPESLREREGKNFEIRLVDGDIRSHKKYYYVVQEYPDHLIFLIDDDIYYPTNIIERTMKTHYKHQDAIIANYGYHIGYTDDGKLQQYNSWKQEYHYSTDSDLFFGSGGGTLICPSKLHKELANIEKARELAPIADDVWLNAIVKFSNRQIVLLDNGLILPVFNKDNVKLASSNKGLSQNDIQLKSVAEYIKSLT